MRHNVCIVEYTINYFTNLPPGGVFDEGNTFAKNTRKGSVGKAGNF